MSSIVLTPIVTGDDAIELGSKLWVKKLLPVGDVEYKGRILHFTPEYVAELARAFAARAYDQVPFQLADAKNAHTNDPERFAGEIIEAEARPDGLYVTLRATQRGEAVLSQNPRLGVSARIVENYERSDGTFYPQALQHVLGTLDPAIPQLGPWQAIEASNPDAGLVIDLSGSEFVPDLSGLDAAPAEVAALDQVLAEIDGELLAGASAGLAGIYADLEALEAAEMDHDGYDDLSQAFEAAELAQAGQRRVIMLAREYGRDAYRRRGDLHEMASVYAEVGVEGTRVDLTNRPGLDSTGQIELAHRIADGRYGRLCGAADTYGRCSSRYHDVGCAHGTESAAAVAASYEDAQAWRAALQRHAAIPVSDSLGRTWPDQAGQPMTMTGHLEAATGQRQGEGVFYAGRDRRELASPMRRRAFGDPSADVVRGEPVSPATAATAARIRMQDTRLASRTAAQIRESARAERDRRIADLALRGRHQVHPDYAETSRERAERLHRPVRLRRLEEPDDYLAGTAATGYAAG